jgi:hypothetical protein
VEAKRQIGEIRRARRYEWEKKKREADCDQAEIELGKFEVCSERSCDVGGPICGPNGSRQVPPDPQSECPNPPIRPGWLSIMRQVQPFTLLPARFNRLNFDRVNRDEHLRALFEFGGR